MFCSVMEEGGTMEPPFNSMLSVASFNILYQLLHVDFNTHASPNAAQSNGNVSDRE